MDGTLQSISLARLAFGFVPALAVVWIMYRWAGQGKTGLYALSDDSAASRQFVVRTSR